MEIPRAAEARPADLIVMGVHGQAVLGRLLLGPVPSADAEPAAGLGAPR
ncbi:MAG TPA: universal stress protein [Vicinamibacteria bacterium]